MKKPFYTELAYVFGILALAVGTALMTVAGFGVSMVVAPAYLLHLKVSQYLPFFSFGMAEYTLQAVVIILMSLILRKFKISYLFSFVTAVIYGTLLDLSLLAVQLIPAQSIIVRAVMYVLGFFLVAMGVSMLFKTYISQGAYEMFVKEVSQGCGFDIHKFKTIYDCISCAIAIILSFAFFGMWNFVGVQIGTVLCAFFNGPTIGLFSRIFDKHYEFKDRLKLRKYFEK